MGVTLGCFRIVTGTPFQIAIEDVVGLGTQLPTMLKEVEDEL